MLAERTRTIDNVLQNTKVNATEGNIFYEKPEFREQIQTSIAKLEKMLSSNNEIERVFKTFNEDVQKMHKLDDLNDKFGEIEDLVVSLDNLVKLNQFEEVLTQMASVSDDLQNMNFSRLMKKTKKIVDRKLGGFKISFLLKALAFSIIGIIFVLIVVIVRKINQSAKGDLY